MDGLSVILTALAAGGVVGLAMGTLGGGGGVLAVPALVYLLGMTPSMAATASLLIVTATSLTALTRHARGGDVCWRTGLQFACAGIPVSAGAAVLSTHLPAWSLTAAFALLAVAAAVKMIAGAPAEAEVSAPRQARAARAVGAGAGLGAVTGLLGVGGGFLAVPALVSAVSLRMRVAIGTSLLVIAVNSVVALTTRLVTGPSGPQWSVIAPFAAAAVLAAWDGRRLSMALSPVILRRAFGVVLVLLAVAMIADLALTAIR
ncbi:putative membrane protein YfcA [Actinokineospora baliensis]|uniref:sulfite exporter TauE/SafE family protein n=1 Tax=Actinokineospora baliensis TaxID=547056 RepID=UPI0027DC5374|nr:sulfite exporter TauE/SafE family protein [Actinokineospora baliensis]MBM7776122.1 putative membrane protein YfcA [Actinokineospora baliensis]